tara:strand:- start:1011 stop:1796 length:786 start_codon:yes stop_codon:yes gene_type:complete
MKTETHTSLDPNYVPEEFRTPFDIIELPSQGLLYKNKVKQVKVEYLTAMDENILSSPNLSSKPDEMIDLLIKRKVKDLGMPVDELLEGDRIAVLIFLRSTAFGEIYRQHVWDDDTNDFVEGEINLNELTQKKLLIKPDEKGEMDYKLPQSGKIIKFKFLTSKEEAEVETANKNLMKRSSDKISQKITLRLEKQVTEIDGQRDKIIISNILKKISLMDSRSLRKYIDENEPGIDFNTKARIQGGESVSCFLRFGPNFFWPKL